MWRILQAETPDDFVLATGEQHTVRDFIDVAYTLATGRTLIWSGKGIDEKAHDSLTGDLRVRVNPEFFRPAEVETLLGDPSKALATLGWKPTTPFSVLVKEMIDSDLA